MDAAKILFNPRNTFLFSISLSAVSHEGKRTLPFFFKSFLMTISDA